MLALEDFYSILLRAEIFSRNAQFFDCNGQRLC